MIKGRSATHGCFQRFRCHPGLWVQRRKPGVAGFTGFRYL